MQKSLNKILIFIVLSFAYCYSDAQSYKFKFYGIEEGLPEQFVYTINQDSNGYLWIGTGSGLSKFNGLEFENILIDSLKNSFISASCIDDKGQLWVGNKNGRVLTLKNNKPVTVYLNKKKTGIVNDIIQLSNGDMLIANQNRGLIKIKANEFELFEESFSGYLIYSVCELEENKILVGTNDGLYIFNLLSRELKEVENTPYTNIFTVKKFADDDIWIGTEDAGLFILKRTKNKYILEKQNFYSDYENYGVRNVIKDNDNDIWICTFGKGVFKFHKDKHDYSLMYNYNSENGLKSDNVKAVFQDNEGSFWIGTYGNGLAYIVDDYFSFYKNDKFSNNVLSVFADENNIWLGLDSNIVRIDIQNANNWESLLADNKVKDKYNFTSIYKDVYDVLWLGTENNGLFKYIIKTGRFSKLDISEDRLQNSVNYVDGFGKNIWVATKNGLIVYDSEVDTFFIHNTANGLPHNNINHFYIDVNEKVWIATQSNDLYYIKDGKKQKINILNNNEILNINQIIEDNLGNLWLATYGNGLFIYDYESFKNLSKQEGLKSNYCYSIILGAKNNIWVGHRAGVSRIRPDAYVKTYGKKDGIAGDCNMNSIYKDLDGNIWIGTTEGVVKYDYRKDKKNTVAPNVNITDIYFSSKRVEIVDPLEMPYDIYKLKIDFIGISFKNPEGVTYKYKLEGYDLEWNTTNQTSISYNRIEDGDFVFKLRACNADGVCTEKSRTINISVSPPIWKQWWFLVSALLIIVYAVYLIIKIREKNHKKLQEYLQKTLDERTKEVVKQKEEIETKNNDITDSINYAQRIQDAILPSAGRLEKFFPGSFIYFRPRDIVSGDFYWIEKLEDRYIIVCADATGHGIPGAFMSLISITLIKDILKQDSSISPSGILTTLDSEIESTLNQDIEDVEKRTNDGLDLSICEINMEKNAVTVSSAMRPVIVYKNDKLNTVKGNRYAVGGVKFQEKKFQEEKIEVSKGDIVYLFSDGYPDQFGGEKGRKLKMNRFRNILMDISQSDDNKRFNTIDDHFKNWKLSQSQIDDVLVIGVQI